MHDKENQPVEKPTETETRPVDVPSDAEIRQAIAVLNAAGGFKLVRKIEKDTDIIL